MIIFNFIFDADVDLFARVKRIPKTPLSTLSLQHSSKSSCPQETEEDEEALVARAYADTGKLD